MQRPGFSFLVCPDSRLAHIELQRILDLAQSASEASNLAEDADMENLLSAGQSAKKEWVKKIYWGDDELGQKFWEDLTLQGLFSTPKAIIVRQANLINAENWKKLSVALGKAHSDIWAIFMLEVDFDKGKAKVPAHIQKLQCWTFAEQKRWIWSSAGLERRNLGIFVRTEANKKGLVFAPGAFEAVLAKMPLEANAILLELDKLYLAASPAPARGNQAGAATERIVEIKHASLLVYETDMDIFAFIRSLQEGNKSLEIWHKLSKDELSGEGSVFSLLALLLREARILWQLLSNEAVFLPPSVLTIKKQLAQKLGFYGLAQMWELCFEAESSIKSGERSPEQAHEALIAGLMRVFSHISKTNSNNLLPRA